MNVIKNQFPAILLGLIISINSFGQQNIQLTQYIFNSLSVNPAYAGYKEVWFAQMALRKQWTGISDAPQTGQVSVDGLIDKYSKKMGIGLQVGADKLGPQAHTSAYVSYAYRLQLDADDTRRLSFGLGAGINQYSLDYSRLTAIDEGDQMATQTESSRMIPDLRIGVYYNAPKWYFGLSMLDLLSNKIRGFTSGGSTADVIVNQRHAYLISGYLFDLNDQIKLRPSLLVKEDFKGPTSVDINSMLILKDRIWLGASYRTGLKLWKKDFEQGQTLSVQNSAAAVAQLFITEAFRVGYSYDYSVSRLRSYESGSHEITLGLTLSKKPSKMLTPRFF
jgi:type IX secretion system PorP/SprF family membrane protein